MPRLTHATPKYRKHRASGQAVVTIAGQDHYLGPHRSKASLVEYDRLIAEWLANNRQPTLSQDEQLGLTVAELLVRYWQFAQGYYVKDGKPTSTLHEIRQAIKPLKRLYGKTQVRDFGPLALKAVRGQMVEGGWLRETVNKRVDSIRRVFKWGVGEELVPASVLHGLQAVSGLKRGRTDALVRHPG